MGKCIIRIKDKYFEWSTVVDAPITYGMTLDELKTHIKAQYGDAGLEHLDDRLYGVDSHGTSMHGDENLQDTINANRAGDDEKEITANQIYEKYTR